jgi:hypothetical protein
MTPRELGVCWGSCFVSQRVGLIVVSMSRRPPTMRRYKMLTR